MPDETPVIYRPATAADLDAMARVYMAAFPASMEHFFGARIPAVAVIADVLRIPWLAEPACATVAERDGNVVGYCLAPANFTRLRRAALRRLGPMLLQWLAGRYRTGLRPLRLVWRDQMAQRRARRHDAFPVEAHILSLAVHPLFQGRGMGRSLLQAGLDYLAAQHVPAVRLETRPDNVPARRLYERYGFRQVGESADSQGRWLIMVKDMSRTP